MNKKTKCIRSVCRRRSFNPKADDWAWLEPPAGYALEIGPGDYMLKSGWLCPKCCAGLQKLFAELDLPHTAERVH